MADKRDTQPRMTEVFLVREERPPMGAKMLRPDAFAKMGQTGVAAEKGLDALSMTGQTYKPYTTPDGQIMAFSDDQQQDPLQVNLAQGGLWAPVTGSGA